MMTPAGLEAAREAFIEKVGDRRAAMFNEREWREGLEAALAESMTAMLELDDTEQEAMDHVLQAMAIISQRWKLKSNHSELAAGVHVLQGFIIQHMLNRVAPGQWGSWFGDQEAAGAK